MLVGGLVLGAHVFDGPAGDGPSQSLEGERGVQVPAAWNRIRVEVLNAGGIQGAAAGARDHLRAQGFDVVYYGNASAFGRGETVVLARTGSAEAARAVAGRLGVTRVEVQEDTTLYVDVTVLLGTDWSPETAGDPDPLEEMEEVGEAWWDLRRLLDGRRD